MYEHIAAIRCKGVTVPQICSTLPLKIDGLTGAACWVHRYAWMCIDAEGIHFKFYGKFRNKYIFKLFIIFV